MKCKAFTNSSEIAFSVSKKIFNNILLLIVFVCLSVGVWGQTTFTTSGTWTCPAGVTSVTVECWGGGGGGGFGRSTKGAAGGGGGGGAYASSVITVTPGNNYTMTIGASGTGGAASGTAGTNGGVTSFGVTTVIAAGGIFGAGIATNNAGSGGAGGTVAGSTGTTRFAGGTGANGVNGTVVTSGGGGGGAGANTLSDGANGALRVGGTGVAPGGNGGNGADNLAGTAGSTFGAGGAGGHRNNNNRAGGDGAPGLVRITYTCPTYSLSATSPTTPINTGSSSIVTLTSSAAGLPVGTYTVTYNLSAPNAATGSTATMTVSSAGSGTFTTSTLANAGATTVTITNLKSGDATNNCSNAISANNTGVINVQVSYCVPTGATNYYLTNVVTASGITNISNSTGASTGGYINYSATISCSNYIGASTSITLTPSTGTNYFYCWIDWNGDGDFADANETIFATSTYTSNYTGTINIPTGTPNGNYRMRVANSWSGTVTACGPSSYGEYEDYTFTVVTAPACAAKPTALTSSSITTTTATISWTAASPAPANGYTYEVRTSGAAGSGATGLVVSGTTVAGDVNDNITGLTANTTYYVYVRSYCGGSDYSAWTSSYSFTTACGTFTIPYSQNFESTTVPAIPSCTSIQNVGSGNNWVTANSPGYGFTSKTLQYSYNYSNAANAWFYTGGIQMSSGTNYRISFRYGNYSSTFPEKLKVAFGTTAVNTSMTTTLLDFPNINQATAQSTYYDFTVPSNGIYYFGFNCYSLANQYYLYVDDILIDLTPTCFTPTAVTSSAVTASTATISWTAASPAPTNGYTYEVRTSGAAGSGVTGLVLSGTTIAGDVNDNITGLSSSTTYYVYVRSFCGGSDYSAWSASHSFTTPCVSISTFPWSENFDAMGSVGNSIIPNCWKIENGSSTPWASGTTALNTYNDPKSSPNYITCNYTPSGTDKYIITPGFDLISGTSYDFNFSWAGDGYAGWTADARYKTSQTGTGSTIMGAAFLTSGTTTTSAYSEVTRTLVAPTTGTYFFIVHINNTFVPYYLGLDDFSVNVTPSCVRPTNLTSSAVIYNSATISWTASTSNPTSGYEYEVRTSGNAGSGSTGLVASGPTAAGVVSANISGLTATTTYYVYVRANCGGSDFSTWTSAYSFTTPCQGIGGSVNVGGGETYTTLTGAGGLFEKINSCGLTSNLTVNITSNLTEAGTNALNQWSNSFTLTILPSAATERVISGNVSDGIIRFNGADGVTIDGRYSGSGQYLRFTNTNTSNAVFEIANVSSNITIEYCKIEAGYYSIYYYSNDGNSNVINNCSIYDFQYYGIYNYESSGSLTISQNTIYQTSKKSSYCYAIYLSYAESVVVEKNKIYDIRPANSYTCYGIYANYSSSVIRNNMIALSPDNNYYVYGIYYTGSNSYSTDIYFNSIYIGGSIASVYNSYGIYKSSAASTFNCKNNIVYNNRTASTAKQYALYFSNIVGITCNNNDLYSPTASYGYVGYWGSNDCQTLVNWQSASGKDDASFNVNPSYTSLTTPYNLHIVAGNGLTGELISGISDDYDGEARVSPAIGADEIAIPVCAGLPNAGTTNISSATGCASVNFNLSVSGLTIAPGISYQWQISDNGSTGWTNIGGATSSSLVTNTTTTQYYRLASTCSYSSQTNFSNAVSYTVTGNSCVCTAYSTDYASSVADEDLGNVTVGTLNNTSTLGAVAGGSGSIAFRYSNYAGITTAPDLQQLATISFSLKSIISSGSFANGFQIYIDYNQNGIFDASERAYSSAASTSGAHTETGSFTLPFSALTGITRMRVVNVETTFPSTTNYAETTYSYGETEDYCVNITAAPPCSGTPNAGVASINLATGCFNTTYTITTTGLTAATGITYQWQSSADGSTGWAGIAGENGSTLTATSSTTLYYRLLTNCSNSGLSNNTNVVSYTVTGADCCSNTLVLYDSGSDGWQGGAIDLYVGGTLVDHYTLAAGAGPSSIGFTTDADEDIEIIYTAGTNGYENTFDIVGPDGIFLVEDYQPFYDGDFTGRGCPIPQGGEICSLSIAFCTGTDYSFPTSVNNPPAPIGPDYGCLSTQPNPVWYYLRIDNPGSLNIEIASDCGDVDYAAWGPYSQIMCDATELTAAGNPGGGGNYNQSYGNLVDCAYSTDDIEYLDIPNALAGEYYMVMINNYANCDGIISFGMISGTGSTDCSIVAPPVSNNGPLCVGQDIELSVNYPVSNTTYSWTGPNGFTSILMEPVILNATPANSGTYSLVITVDGVTSDPETTDVVVSNPTPTTAVATGDFVFRNIGNDWNDPANWLECTGINTYSVSAIVPVSTDNVIICSGVSCASNVAIVATADAYCNKLYIESGSSLTMSGTHNLTVVGNWTNNGTFTPGDGTVIFNGTTTISGTTVTHDFNNIVINLAATLIAPTANLNVAGNWTNNQTFNHSSGTVTFNGNALQTINSGVSNFYNMTVVNAGAGLKMASQVNVLNQISMVSGNIDTDSRILSLGLSGAAPGNLNYASGIVYGPFRRWYGLATTSGSASSLFPVGYSGIGDGYLPVLIEYTVAPTNAGTLKVEYNNSSMGASPTGINIAAIGGCTSGFAVDYLNTAGFWAVTKADGFAGGTYDITLNPKGLSGFEDICSLTALKRSAAVWEEHGTHVEPMGSLVNPTIKRTGVTTGFSDWGAAGKSETILPVELAKFEAICNENFANISWTTLSEINNDYFILERSKDMSNFIEIARIVGHGNSSISVDYSFSDNKMLDGTNYYRLKQVDFDGTMKVYQAISINCDGQNKTNAKVITYPNPFRSELNVYFENLENQEVIVEIYDGLGNIVRKHFCDIKFSSQLETLDLGDLRPAFYNLKVISNNQVFNLKIIKN